MAHRCPLPLPSQGTEHLEPDNDSDRDSGVGEDADSCHGGAEEEEEEGGGGEEEEEGVNTQSGVEEEGSAVCIAFQGNMEDEDFPQKLECVLRGIPNMLALGEFPSCEHDLSITRSHERGCCSRPRGNRQAPHME